MTVQKHILSKSTFIRGCQCHKSLYMYKFHPELRDEITEAQQAIFNRGTSIGELAQQVFPGGVNMKPATPFEYQKSVQDTTNAINAGEEIIYEAAFQYNGVLAALDILIKENGKWKIVEVKSSASVSDTYILDTALQYWILTNCGYEVSDVGVLFLNNKYIRNGELDLRQLFTYESTLLKVLPLQDFVNDQVEEQLKLIKEKKLPSIDIGLQCADPYNCDFLGYCWKHIPEYSVFNISRLRAEKKFELYYKGIVKLEDIPEDYSLNVNQWMQVNSEKTGKKIIDKVKIRKFLDSIKYPVFFMDFETFMPALPLYNNSRPYQQIPFQYSLHYLKKPYDELQHFEFLAEANLNIDPRIAFIEQLLADTESKGVILVYNEAFEKARLAEIAKDFPVYNDAINERISRIVDLMVPFREKSIYFPEMMGSYSIKKVLPALIPELSYNELEIHHGGMASMGFEQLFNETDTTLIEKTRRNLLEYCKMDTFAMVKLMEYLENE